MSIKDKSCKILQQSCMPAASFKKRLQLRCKDLSMSHDQKAMRLLPPVEKCPMGFYQGVDFTAFDNSSSCDSDKDICQSHMNMR